MDEHLVIKALTSVLLNESVTNIKSFNDVNIGRRSLCQYDYL